MNLEASEQSILNSIIQILAFRRIAFVHIRNSGSIAHVNGSTVFVRAKFQQKGVPDLMFSYHGVPVACEVKSRTGRVRPEQTEWLKRWTEAPNLGYSFVARSVDDVLNHLEILDKR